MSKNYFISRDNKNGEVVETINGYVDERKKYVENLLEVSNSIIVYDLLNKKEIVND